MLADRPTRQSLVAQVDQERLEIRDDLLAWEKISGQPHPARGHSSRSAVGQPAGLLDGHDSFFAFRAMRWNDYDNKPLLSLSDSLRTGEMVCRQEKH